jgi:hypothetical protein
VSASQLQVAVQASDVAALGPFPVQVVSPTTGGGGGTSASATFTVYAPPSASTAVINSVVGNGTPALSANGTTLANAEFNNPQLLTFDAAGNLYVADYGNNRIREITSTGVYTIAGGGSSLGDGGPATSAQLSGPIAVVIDGLGNLYISEQNSHRIRRVAAVSGGFVQSGTVMQSAARSGSGRLRQPVYCRFYERPGSQDHHRQWRGRQHHYRGR